MNNDSGAPAATASCSNERSVADFQDTPILEFLRLGNDYGQLPSADPIAFLQKNQHLKRLPPYLLSSFAAVTTPKQRTVIPAIRNRRLRYVNSQPAELEFDNARDSWPDLWQGQDRYRVAARHENQDERAWAQSHFLGGEKQHVGKLGSLLGDYAEERVAERLRTSRRRAVEEFIPEEEDSEDSEGDHGNVPNDSPEEARANFERLIRERFIYGLLDTINYDAVDWNDQWDLDNDRLDEERWFDDEEESV